jgi:hypothetical protein
MSVPEAFSFSRAGPADEPEIRRLVGSVPMRGTITVRFEREPDYFLGCSVMGDVCDVLLARHDPDGELCAVVCRSERMLFVDGKEVRVGSIGQVRVAPRYQGMRLLHHGVGWFREHGPRDLLYTGVVARDNSRARAVMLERRPPGGLHAQRLCGITTHALLLRRGQGTWGRRPRRSSIAVHGATHDRLDDIVAFLRRRGAKRQMFPVWSASDFTGGQVLRDMTLDDVSVATLDGTIVGVLGTWDQSAFKQDIVHAYPRAISRLRPVWDSFARIAAAPSLPAVGSAIPQAFAAFPCVEDDDPGIFALLLARAARRAARHGRGFLLVGLADEDPLARGLGHWPSIRYHSDLFALSWTEAHPAEGMDGRVPYVEIGTL